MDHLIPIAALLLAAGEASPPRFELTGDGKRITGVIEKMTKDGSISLSADLGGKPSTIAGSDVVALRRLDPPIPPWPWRAHVVLGNGDRVAGVPTELAGAFVHIRADLVAANSSETKELRFPVTAISLMWLSPPDSIDREKYVSLAAGSRPNDQIVLHNGDIVSGTMIGLDAKKGELQIDVGGEKRTVSLSKVVVVAFNTRLTRNRKPAGSYAHAVLSNGTRMTLLSPTIQNGELTAQTQFKDTVRLALADLAALDIYQGKAVYLSDLRPRGYRYRTYQGEQFDWSADRSLADRELQLRTRTGVSTFDKGLAVHGACTLTYDLGGKFSRFEGLVGLDPLLGKRGSAAIRILVDGKERKLGDAKDLTLENGPQPIDIDVKGAKELTLAVDWGDGGNVGDYVNWCDARLIP